VLLSFIPVFASRHRALHFAFGLQFFVFFILLLHSFAKAKYTLEFGGSAPHCHSGGGQFVAHAEEKLNIPWMLQTANDLSISRSSKSHQQEIYQYFASSGTDDAPSRSINVGASLPTDARRDFLYKVFSHLTLPQSYLYWSLFSHCTSFSSHVWKCMFWTRHHCRSVVQPLSESNWVGKDGEVLE
jgi:hypothetical protein